MIALNRRDLLKAMASAGIATGVLSSFGLRHLAFAAGNNPLLVIIHLRGGCDGLNLISPANDPAFIDARASDMRVLDQGKDAGYSLANGLGKDIDFRLHNAAGGLSELYKSGQLAFVHACGLTDATRSHFVATDMIEAGVATELDLAHAENGWLARSLMTSGAGVPGLEAMAISGAVAGDLRGFDRALAAGDINGGLGPIGGSSVSALLWQMYGQRSDALAESAKLALALPVLIDQNIARDAQGHVVAYAPANGANYDSAGGFANALKSLARLIKMDIGLKTVTLDYGNWDTHENQPGRFRSQLEPFSNGLAALWNDIAAYHNRVTIVAVTEFGRRLRSNKSNGTDHGRAGVMTLLGGAVHGGRLYGKWPGLAAAQLDEGVDLAVTTDYRQVLAETLTHTTGGKAAQVFPGFHAPGNLGLFV